MRINNIYVFLRHVHKLFYFTDNNFFFTAVRLFSTVWLTVKIFSSNMEHSVLSETGYEPKQAVSKFMCPMSLEIKLLCLGENGLFTSNRWKLKSIRTWNTQWWPSLTTYHLLDTHIQSNWITLVTSIVTRL